MAVIVDVKSRKVLAAARPEATARLHSAPGSTLKPFFLATALEQGKITSQATIACERRLHIAGRDLTCTHPRSQTAFNAEDALAYSCNSYFAALAQRFSPAEIESLLTEYGLAAHSSQWFRNPETTEQIQLTALGLEGIQVTPRQLAMAYVKLATAFGLGSSKLAPVKSGLEGSVRYGMAHNADVSGMSIAGKTGTASDPGQRWTHGWFAGLVPGDAPRTVVVIYVPRGSGADAAILAGRFFRTCQELGLR